MGNLHYHKILLVHPLGYPLASADQDIARKANIMPPLGLAGLAAYVGRKGLQAEIVDYFARPLSDPRVGDYLRKERPAFIGFSCTTSSFLDGVRIARMAKGIIPEIQTIFGGAHVSSLKTRVLASFPEVDFAVVGEGEETLAELMACHGRYPEVLAVPGLVFRDPDGNPTFTGYRKKGVELDTLPFPAYEKLEGFPQTYLLPIFNYPKRPNTSCLSSRGCPYACSYCDRSVFGNTYRINSAEYLYTHLHYLRERFGIRHVNFYDDHFTLHRKRTEDFIRRMVDRPLGMTFNCAVRAEHIDQDLLKGMKEAGCWMISLGIETGDPELLTRHRRNADLEMLAEKIHLIKKHRIRVKGLLMLGLPGETEDSIRRTMAYVFSLPIDDINISKFTPFPGTPLYERIHELGTFEEDWERMDCMHFLFVPRGLTRERLEDIICVPGSVSII